MRLDKFLKISRIIKRRSVAKEVADKGRIQINGKLAKSSSDVKVGDILKVQFGNKTLEVKITNELLNYLRNSSWFHQESSLEIPSIKR